MHKIKTAFQNWIWSDPDRTDRLARVYNDRFNNIVPRAFDGSHLKLPGASGAFVLYGHQKRGIWRIIASGATYLAHAVGAGKTMTMAAAIMEQRRLGLVAKAMLVVPGHCLAQAAREFLALYPGARILVADETNFTKDKRHRFLSRAATATWDAIIITHSAFRFIGVPSAFEQQMIQDELELYEQLLTKVESDDRVSRKRLERLKEGLKERLEALATRKDDLLTISEIGVDQIIVDEAQEFRKLSFATNMSTLKGVDPNGSQRAWDLYVKSRFIETKNPGRALVLASGTPITNTLGEMFSVQRYLGYAALLDRGAARVRRLGLDLRRRLDRARASAVRQVQAGHALRHLRQRPRTDRHVPVLRRRGDAGGSAAICEGPGDLDGQAADPDREADTRLQALPAPCSTRGSRRSRCATGRRSRATTSCSPSSPTAAMRRSTCVWSIRTTTTSRTTS